MKKELPTKYDHLAVEKGKYQQWLDKEYFKAGDLRSLIVLLFHHQM